MTDLNNDGAAAPDDSAMFEATVSSIPDNPAATPEPAPSPEPVAQTPAEPATPSAPEPAIPPGVLREEKEARRAAERRAEALERQLTALQPKPEPKPRSDVFENPSAFVQEEVQPILDPVQNEIRSLREFYSQRDAVREHGQEKVVAAYNALHEAAVSGDPEATAVVQRVKQSMDPFGDIVKWHTKSTVLSQIGTDINAYNQRIIDEALKNPEVQKRFLETARAQAQQSGNVVTRPAVSTLPSLNKVGSVALPEAASDVSDDDLWNNTTSRKRA